MLEKILNNRKKGFTFGALVTMVMYNNACGTMAPEIDECCECMYDANCLAEPLSSCKDDEHMWGNEPIEIYSACWNSCYTSCDGQYLHSN